MTSCLQHSWLVSEVLMYRYKDIEFNCFNTYFFAFFTLHSNSRLSHAPLQSPWLMFTLTNGAKYALCPSSTPYSALHPPPQLILMMIASFNELGRNEMVEENGHGDVFGVRLYLFELTVGAAGEGETQVHPCNGADASQACVCIIFLSESIFNWTKNQRRPRVQTESAKN